MIFIIQLLLIIGALYLGVWLVCSIGAFLGGIGRILVTSLSFIWYIVQFILLLLVRPLIKRSQTRTREKLCRKREEMQGHGAEAGLNNIIDIRAWQ